MIATRAGVSDEPNLVDVVQTLHGYGAWATARVLDAAAALTPNQFLADASGGYGSVRDTLDHAVSAQAVWLARAQETARAPGA